jgi:branched-chain amino acid transport system ATP-binding protein
MSVCDDIHVLDFGRIIATGPPAEVRANPRVQEAYLGYSDAPTVDPAAIATLEGVR